MRAEEPGADPHSFGTEHQRGGNPPTVGDPAGRDDGHRRDRVDDRGHERQRRDPAGVAARLRALGRHHVDARFRRLSRRGDRPHLAHDHSSGLVRDTDKGRGVGKRNRDDPHSLVERDGHQLRGTGKMADEPDTERTIGQLTRPPYLRDQPVGTTDGRPTDESEAARFRYRSRELGRRVATTHRRVEDRMLDLEQITQARAQCHDSKRNPQCDASPKLRTDRLDTPGSKVDT